MFNINDIAATTLTSDLFKDNFEYSDSSISMSDAMQFNQNYINNMIGGGSSIYDNAIQDIQNDAINSIGKDKIKISNEINPVVLENEHLRYQKELEAYEKKKNDIKIKYKKKPVAEVRGEIYREDKDNRNRNIGLALLGIAGGIGAIGLANKAAIGKGMQKATNYIRENSYQRKDKNHMPTGEHYVRDSSVAQGFKTNPLKNPMEATGELAAKLAYDVSTHGSQRYLWMIHPLDQMSRVGKRLIDPNHKLGGPGQALILGAALQPAIAASGAYNILNPGELFRPEGFKQSNPAPENQKESTAPGEELFLRFAMGRTGRPLKYSDAKEEIPDLTPGRYKDYMRYMYQDKGLLNLGLAKATDENLQGIPEARVLGYPVTLNSVSTFAGGILGSRLGMNLVDLNQKENVIANKVGEEVRKKMSIDELEEELRKVNERAKVAAETGEYPGRELKKGSMKHMLGGLGGVAAGAIAGHFLGRFIEDQIKKGNDEKRRIQEIEENGYKPRGLYTTDGNNKLTSL